jgi:hypothetical protein
VRRQRAHVHVILVERLPKRRLGVLVVQVLVGREVGVADEAATAQFDALGADAVEVVEHVVERFVSE